MATKITKAYRFQSLERKVYAINQPTLNPPSITTNGEKLSIADNVINGLFTEEYNLYINNNYITSTDKRTIDFSTIKTPEGFLEGDVTVTAVATNFNESNHSNISFIKLKGYNIIENNSIFIAELYTTYTEKQQVFTPGSSWAYLD